MLSPKSSTPIIAIAKIELTRLFELVNIFSSNDPDDMLYTRIVMTNKKNKTANMMPMSNGIAILFTLEE